MLEELVVVTHEKGDAVLANVNVQDDWEIGLEKARYVAISDAAK